MWVQSYFSWGRCVGIAVYLAVSAMDPPIAVAAPGAGFDQGVTQKKKTPARSGQRLKVTKRVKMPAKPVKPHNTAAKPTSAATPSLAAPAPNATPHSAAAPSVAPGPLTAPTLDLSAPSTEQDAQAAQRARQEILGTPTMPRTHKAKGTIDFGSGVDFWGGSAKAGVLSFDLGTDESMDLDLTTADTHVAQRKRLEAAMELMADEVYDKAAMEFRFCLTDAAFADFVPEVQYQLARALYKMGFYPASHAQFQKILEVGPSHRRFRKAVEWLFFMSRKVADQEPVLAELAKFRNVTFPKAYHDEYAYLLAKYLFIQANALEIRRLEEDELTRGKQAKDSSIDFGAMANAIAGQASGALDFSDVGGATDLAPKANATGGALSLDFGAAGDASADRRDANLPITPAADALDFGAPATPSSQPLALPTTTAEAVKQGLDLVAQVSADSVFYPQTKYLEGLLHALAGAEQNAVEAFQEVVRLLGPKYPNRNDPNLREMAFLSLARIHFGHKQFNRSVYYYDLISRDSENWLTALFEASWAYYQRGDYEKALGNLLTLHSPFFAREYFPESQIVRAIIYFESCRYDETRQIVDEFISQYSRLMRKIQKVAQSQDLPEVIYSQLMQLAQANGPQKSDTAEPQKTDTAARVLSLMVRSPEIQTAQAVVAQVQRERQVLAKNLSPAFGQSTLGSELTLRLNEEALTANRHAGEVIKQKFEQELYKLKSLLGQALRIKIEVASAERDALEARARNQAPVDEVVAAVSQTVVDDEHLYWPYEGEYWRDELGTYELDFSMCRQLRE